MIVIHRYLHKMFSRRLNQSQLPSNIVYLASDYPVHTCAVKAPEQFLNTEVLLEIYQQRARRMVESAAEQYTENLNEGMDSELARNECSIDWINAARVSHHATFYAASIPLVGFRLIVILLC